MPFIPVLYIAERIFLAKTANVVMQKLFLGHNFRTMACISKFNRSETLLKGQQANALVVSSV